MNRNFQTYVCLIVFFSTIASGWRVLAADLRGELVREVHNPFGDLFVGFGLATDGPNLYASSSRDGTIRRFDAATLDPNGSISTPGSIVLGLDYLDGLLYAVDARGPFVTPSESRIFAVSPQSGDTLLSFDAPDYILISLTHGPNGSLFAMENSAHVYELAPDSGQLLATLTGETISVDPFLTTIDGADIIELMPDGSFLVDDNRGGTRLSVFEREGSVLIRQTDFVVPGLPERDWRGSAFASGTLYLWGQTQGETWFYEVQVIPEPASAYLLVIALLLLNTRLCRSRWSVMRNLLGAPIRA